MDLSSHKAIKSLASAEFYIFKLSASRSKNIKQLLKTCWNKLYSNPFPESAEDSRIIEAIAIAKQRKVYIEERVDVPPEIEGVYVESTIL